MVVARPHRRPKTVLLKEASTGSRIGKAGSMMTSQAVLG